MKRTPLSLLVLFLTAAAHAGDVKRANNNTVQLNNTAAWQTGALPTASDVVVFDNTGVPAAATATTVTASNIMGANLAVQGIRVANNVTGTINTTNYLGIHNNNSASPSTLSLGTSGVDMSAANHSLRIQAPVTITGNQTWTVANANTGTNVMGFNNSEDLSFDAPGAQGTQNTVVNVPFNLGGFTVTTAGAGTTHFTSGYLISNGTLNVGSGITHVQGGGNKVTTVDSTLTTNIAAGAVFRLQSNSGHVAANGPINLNGGTLGLLSNNASNTVTVNGALNVAATSAILVNSAANGPTVINSNITGSAALNTNNTTANAARFLQLAGDNSGYSGTITLSGASTLTRLNTATSGSASAIWSVSAGHTLQTNGVSVNLGTLNGAGIVNSAAGSGNVSVGAGNFSGTLVNGAGTLSLTKTGTGTLLLTGANTYTGATAVNDGTLLATPAQTGVTPVTVGNTGAFGVNLVTAGTTLAVPSVTTGSGSAIVINTGSTGNPVAPPLNAGALNASAGPVAVRVLGSALVPGSSIPLIGYSSLSGFSNLSAVLPPRTIGNLVDNPGASRIDLDILSVDKPRWRGDVSTDWDVDNGSGTGTLNWREITSGNATRILQGAGGTDSATFDDTASTGTVNLTTTLTPAGITVDNSSLNYSFTGSGKLSGSGSLVKSGSGTLTIANTTLNDYSGTTTINDGTVSVGDGVTPGGGSLGTGPVVNNAILTLNRPDDFAFAAAVTGTGLLAKENTNTVNFAASTSLGNVAINNGTLRFDAGGTISGALSGTGNLRAAGGTVAIAGPAANSFTGLTTVSAGTLQLNTTGGNAIGGNLLITGTGGLTLSQLDQISDAATITYDKAINGGTVTIANEVVGAITILNGHDSAAQIIANTGLFVDGPLTIGGTGVFAVASNHTSNVGSVTLNGNAATLRIAANSNPSTLSVGIGGISAQGGFIQVGQGTGAFDGVLILEGNYSATGNVLISDGAFAGTQKREIYLASAVHTFTTAAGTTTTVEPDFAGGASLIKAGAGTMTLAARSNSTYTGDTVISGGVLNVLGSIAGSNVIIGSGALAGTGLISTGTVGADLNAGGSIAPGSNGAGTLTLNVGGGKLDLADAVAASASGALACDIDAPAASDQIVLAGGALDIGSGVFGIDDITFTAGAGLAPGVYTLIAGDTPITGTFAANVTGPVGTMTGTLSKGDSDTDLILTVTNLTALQSWRQTHFGTTDNTGSAANDADPDADGLNNIIEYLLSTIPTDAASAQTLTVADDGANFSLTYSRAKAALTDVDVFNEAATDLTAWAGSGVTESILSDDGTTQVVKVSVAKTLDRRQLRVRAAQK